MLGGSSSVSTYNFTITQVDCVLKYLADGLVFTRGSSDDWDAYAAIAEDASWTWENIQRYLPLVIRLPPVLPL